MAVHGKPTPPHVCVFDKIVGELFVDDVRKELPPVHTLSRQQSHRPVISHYIARLEMSDQDGDRPDLRDLSLSTDSVGGPTDPGSDSPGLPEA